MHVKILAKYLRKGILLFSSRQYTSRNNKNKICIPLLEKNFKTFNIKTRFFVCYSPEKVNPGDKTHTLKKISKK